MSLVHPIKHAFVKLQPTKQQRIDKL